MAASGDITFQFPESDSARGMIAERWLFAPVETVAPLKSAIVTDMYGDSFEVSAAKTGNLVSVTVKPAYTDSVAGAWRLDRDAESGEPVSITVTPVNDPSIILTIRPGSGAKTLIDLSLYGLKVRNGVPFGMAFRSVLTAPLSSVAALTAKTVPWELLFPETLRYGNVAAGVSTIRARLPQLVYLDDGAFDDAGKPVLISTGAPQDPKAVLEAAKDGRDLSKVRGGVNCSGFAKWIVDGIVKPTAGSRTFIRALERQTSSPETGFTERYRDPNDVFFGLDWIRNLAAAVVSLELGHTVYPEDAGADVTDEPFSGATGYETDVGYKVSELMPLLYWLAAREPGHWYLGALSEELGERGNAKNPLLRYYNHVAAFFPWFDETGRFRLAVFESASETPVSAFLENNADDWIFLVRLDMPPPIRFDP